VKSTLFKGIISRKTTFEFAAFFQSMARYMSDGLAGPMVTKTTIVVDDATMVKATETAQEEAKTVRADLGLRPAMNQQRSFPRERVLLAFMLLLQFWILTELRGIKRTMLVIDERSSANGQCEAKEYL
jgi:hypothetical protein